MTETGQQAQKARVSVLTDLYSLRQGWAIAILLTSTVILLILKFFKNNSLQIGIVMEPVTSIKDADCALTVGSWCPSWNRQTDIERKAPRDRSLKNCLWNCNGVGVCDYLSGICRCPAGWTGPSCSERMDRPCSQFSRPGWSFTPFDQPYDRHRNSSLVGSCAGHCDRDYGSCYCPKNTKYGRIEAPEGSPPGASPKQRGRQLSLHCQPKNGTDGSRLLTGEKTWDDIFGDNGWCQSDNPQVVCPCIEDGVTGLLCDQVRENFCVNQCSGRGQCDKGFCKCDLGYYGQDCANRVPQEFMEMNESSTMHTSTRNESSPWIQQFARTPAMMVLPPEKTRKRPLIFIYDMNPVFDQVLLQYRIDSGNCAHRIFDGFNNSIPMSHVYCSETGLHELLLQSEHRTLDPEEADFFYMPMYTACLQFPIAGFLDHPWFHTPSRSARVYVAASMLHEAQHWVRSQYPYWDRKQGRDHFLVRFLKTLITYNSL